MTPTEQMAWAAGFIDGEGSVTLSVGRHQRQISLRVSAGQIVTPPLERLHGLFGGASVKTQNKRNFVYHEWRVFSQRAADCLTAIRPFLTVKDGQADVALEFWRICSRPVGWNTKRDSGRAQSFTVEERELRMEFVRRMRALNHKSRHLITLPTDSY